MLGILKKITLLNCLKNSEIPKKRLYQITKKKESLLEPFKRQILNT